MRHLFQISYQVIQNGNSHPITLVWMRMREYLTLWGIPTYGKSCGSGMGMGIEILYPRQPWTEAPTYNNILQMAKSVI